MSIKITTNWYNESTLTDGNTVVSPSVLHVCFWQDYGLVQFQNRKLAPKPEKLAVGQKASVTFAGYKITVERLGDPKIIRMGNRVKRVRETIQ